MHRCHLPIRNPWLARLTCVNRDGGARLFAAAGVSTAAWQHGSMASMAARQHLGAHNAKKLVETPRETRLSFESRPSYFVMADRDIDSQEEVAK